MDPLCITETFVYTTVLCILYKSTTQILPILWKHVNIQIYFILYARTLWVGDESHTGIYTSSGLVEKGIIIFTSSFYLENYRYVWGLMRMQFWFLNIDLYFHRERNIKTPNLKYGYTFLCTIQLTMDFAYTSVYR